MTDSQVAALRKGMVVHEPLLIGPGCVPFTVVGDAHPAKALTHHEAYAVSRTGAMTVRVTLNGNFHRPGDCPFKHRRLVKGTPKAKVGRR